MEPYESVYAGQFVFTLGFLAGVRGFPPAQHTIALLAQNRGDELIGDLVASWSGRRFIVEFKRHQRAVRSEFRKPAKKRLLGELREAKNAQWLDVSRRSHFLAFGKIAEGAADIRIIPYADIEDADAQRATSPSMSEFFEKMQQEEYGFGSKRFTAYVVGRQAHGASGRRFRQGHGASFSRGSWGQGRG